MQEDRGQNENIMADKTPVRVVFNASNVATGMAEFQSGETVPVSNGGTGLTAIGSAGQVLRTNAAGNALEFATLEDLADIVSVGSTLTAPSNADFNITTAGTGNIVLNDLSISDNTLTTNRSNDDLHINASGTGTVVLENLKIGTSGSTITTILDEDAMGSNSATSLATQQSIKAYVDAQDANIASDTLTLTNKTFDVEATGNSISNIDVADLKSGVLDTDISSVAGTDTTLASAKAIKTYVDAQVAGKDNSDEITEGSTNLYFTNARADARITAALIDEDDMSSNSATRLPSQQSVKAYVDGEVSSLSSTTITQGNTSVVVSDTGSNGAITLTAEGNTELVVNDTSATFSGNVIVAGDFTVNGTTTTVSTTNTAISDNIIELNSGTSSSGNDAGIIIERGSTGNNAFIGWDESADKFSIGTTTATAADKSGGIAVTKGTLLANIEGNVTGNVSGSSGSTTGNAATATALATARNIAGQSFDGTGAITIASTDLSNTSAITLNTASQTLTNKTLTAPVINSPTGDFIKIAGTNFTGSLLVGHSTHGTLNAAQENTGVGIGTLDALTSGDRNTALGHDAGTLLTTSSHNTLIGYEAGKGVVSANLNTAIGSSAFAGSNTDSNSASNTVVGAFAMNVSSGAKENTAIGRDAGREVTTGDSNIFIGYNAGANDNTSGITTGSGNVIIGTVDPDSRTGDRQLKIAGYDGSTTTTWIAGDSSGNLTTVGDVTLANNKKVIFGDAGESISGDGTDLTISSSAKVDMKLGSGNPTVAFYSDGTQFGHIKRNSGKFDFRASESDADITFRGNDGGSGITALTLDMSEAGAATFNAGVTATTGTFSGNVAISGDLTVSGNTSTVSTTNTTIADNIIELNTGISQSLNDAGIIIERGSTGNNAAIIWDESADTFVLGTTTATAADKSGGITIDAGSLKIASLEADGVTITDNVITSNSSNADLEINANGSGSVVIGADLTVDTNTLHVDSSNNRVGINTTSPTQALTIDGGNNAKIAFLGGGFQSIYYGDSSSATAAFVHYDHGSDNYQIDVSGTITLDAPTSVKLSDNGTQYGQLEDSSNDLVISSVVSDKDMIFKGNDGGSTITALTLDMSAAGTATFNHDVILPNDGILQFGDAGENIVGDGTNLTISSSGKTIIDSTGDIELDAASGVIDFIAGGTVYGNVAVATNDLVIKSRISDGDMSFRGNDGGAEVTALSLDMSAAGAATFNDKITLGTNKAIEFVDANESVKSDGTNLIFTSGGTTFKMPIADGNAGDVLKTDGAGTMSFASAAATASDDTRAVTKNNKSVSTSPRTVDYFQSTSADLAWYFVALNDLTNDHSSSSCFAVTHNNSNAFVSSARGGSSGSSNSLPTTSADISSGQVRVKIAAPSADSKISYYKIPISRANTADATAGVTVTTSNTDVDSASESIDTFAHASFRAAKYLILIDDNAKTETGVTEALVVHDGTNAFVSQYGTINTGNNDMIILSAAISGSNVVLSAAGLTPNLSLKIHKILLSDSMSAVSNSNQKIIGATTVSSSATVFDDFDLDDATAAVYYVVGKNATEGAFSVQEVYCSGAPGEASVSQGPFVSTKATVQLEFTAAFKSDADNSVELSVASTSGGSTVVNAYRINCLAE